MKYIKLYENQKKYAGEYWLLPIDGRFESSLEKINVPKILKKWLYLNNTNIYNSSKYFIFVGYSYIDNDPWIWMPFKFNMNNYFDEENYKFLGFINTSKEEVDFYINAEKYNL